jgi:hypothetical protein
MPRIHAQATRTATGTAPYRGDGQQQKQHRRQAKDGRKRAPSTARPPHRAATVRFAQCARLAAIRVLIAAVSPIPHVAHDGLKLWTRT